MSFRWFLTVQVPHWKDQYKDINPSICGCQWQGQSSLVLFALSTKNLLSLSLISNSDVFPQETTQATNYEMILLIFHKVYAPSQWQR